MALVDVHPYLALVPALKELHEHTLWSHYDPEADTLAIHFREPNVADESEMTDDGIIICYDHAGEVIGLTILQASTR